MIHEVLQDARKRSLERGDAAIFRRSALVTLGLLLLIVAFCAFVLPHVYGLAAYGVGYSELMNGSIMQHVILNCAANALTILSTLPSSKDRLDRKLANLLTTTLLIHGCMAFFILVARQPHSNMMLPLGVLISATGGAIVMYVRHRTTVLKIALIGPADDAIADQLLVPFDRITNPTKNLRPYDILLTAGVVDLSEEWAEPLSRAMLSGQSVRHLAEFVEESRGLVSIDHFDVEHLPPAGLTSYRTRKRLMDIGLVLLSAPVALPILLVGMLLVLVTMGRPIVFTQTRVGLRGDSFRMYKLRSMRPIGPAEAVRTTTKGDARVTPVGRWLRRFRVDELPQLWNVLKGDMSIIGPRPEWSVLSEQYIRELPVYAYRHLVRPGITGWAQVRGGYAGDLAETRIKVGYDLFYIKNLSFALDVQILIRTVWTLASGSGAR